MTTVVHSWSMKNVFPPISVVEIVTFGIAVKAIYRNWINQFATIGLNTNQITTLIYIRNLHQDYFQLLEDCKKFLFLLSQIFYRNVNFFLLISLSRVLAIIAIVSGLFCVLKISHECNRTRNVRKHSFYMIQSSLYLANRLCYFKSSYFFILLIHKKLCGIQQAIYRRYQYIIVKHGTTQLIFRL